jgi:LysM repeat protein
LTTSGVAAADTHTVRAGDTLGEIATAHGVTVAALVEANHLSDADVIRIGQVLTIPPSHHTVVAGETLTSIASRYGVSLSALVAVNAISNANLVRIGQVLTIPAGDTENIGGHVVQPGETLAGIAARYGLSVTALAAANGITDGRVYAGTRLLLTSPGSYSAPGGTSGTHVVRSGETLSGIAAANGTSVAALAAVNAIADVNRLIAGAILRLSTAGFLCPVPSATFVNDFGFPRTGGRWHEGNDMFAALGTPVYAPASGRVVILTGAIGGIQFTLTTGDGTYFIGSHLSRAGKTGTVSAGDVIGYVGATGNAVGGRPHLHFEIHPFGGGAVNPYPTISSAC